MKRLILVLVALLVTAPAFASTWSGSKTISGQTTALFSFVAADGTGNDSDLFTAKGYFTACFDPDTAGTAGTGAVIVRRCPTNTKPGTPANACISTGGANGNANLTGTEGPKTTQNACERYGPGYYFIDIVTVCGGNNCQVSIQGE